jgi:hypothetical protein
VHLAQRFLDSDADIEDEDHDQGKMLLVRAKHRLDTLRASVSGLDDSVVQYADLAMELPEPTRGRRAGPATVQG